MTDWETENTFKPSPEKYDQVDHPAHYTSSGAVCANCQHPIECIDVTRHMGFALGNVVKYIWRHHYKDGVIALRKARWYLDDAIEQLIIKQEQDNATQKT